MRTVLVTGGAGYIGAHACLRLAEAGYQPVVFDNLCNGHAGFAQWGPLELGDIRDAGRLDEVFARHRPVAVLHFAALIEVGQSVRNPGRFYETNVAGSICVIEAARRSGVEVLVFSSSCAVYGAPIGAPMDEDHPVAPLNPYGHTKLMVEQVLRDLDRHCGFRSIALRYFNAAGADPEGRIGERHDPETHALPLAIRAAMTPAETFRIYGDDYDTPDGSAVRDYVHVLDLADAHVLALKRLLDGGPSDAINLGAGAGVSVRELVEAVGRRANRRFTPLIAPRREGDAASLVADNRRARDILGWSPRFSLDDIVETAWRWHAAEAQRAGVG